jgi:hypothetical protein
MGLPCVLAAAMTLSHQPQISLSNGLIQPKSPIGAKDVRSSRYLGVRFLCRRELLWLALTSLRPYEEDGDTYDIE